MNIIFSSYFGCYYKTAVVEEFSAALLPRAMQDSGKMLRADVVNVWTPTIGAIWQQKDFGDYSGVTFKAIVKFWVDSL